MKKILTFIVVLALAAQVGYAAPRKPTDISFTVALKHDNLRMKCSISNNILFRGNNVFVEYAGSKCGWFKNTSQGTGYAIKFNGKSTQSRLCKIFRKFYTCDDGTKIEAKMYMNGGEFTDLIQASTNLREGTFKYEIVDAKEYFKNGKMVIKTTSVLKVVIDLTESGCNVSQYEDSLHGANSEGPYSSRSVLIKQLKCEVSY